MSPFSVFLSKHLTGIGKTGISGEQSAATPAVKASSLRATAYRAVWHFVRPDLGRNSILLIVFTLEILDFMVHSVVKTCFRFCRWGERISMRDTDEIIAKFRKAGSKITPQRLTIFKLLQGNRKHPSAEDVYKEILKIHPSISFTTVYKTLQTLRDMGEVKELTIDPERAHYDPVVEDHIHTFCQACRRIGDLDMGFENAGPIQASSAHTPDFTVHSVEVHFVGLCEECR